MQECDRRIYCKCSYSSSYIFCPSYTFSRNISCIYSQANYLRIPRWNRHPHKCCKCSYSSSYNGCSSYTFSRCTSSKNLAIHPHNFQLQLLLLLLLVQWLGWGWQQGSWQYQYLLVVMIFLYLLTLSSWASTLDLFHANPFKLQH